MGCELIYTRVESYLILYLLRCARNGTEFADKVGGHGKFGNPTPVMGETLLLCVRSQTKMKKHEKMLPSILFELPSCPRPAANKRWKATEEQIFVFQRTASDLIHLRIGFFPHLWKAEKRRTTRSCLDVFCLRAPTFRTN